MLLRTSCALLIFVAGAKAFRADDTVVEDSSVAEAQDAFAQWKSLHKVSYATAAEEEWRFAVWTASRLRLAEAQHENPHARFALDATADGTAAELQGGPLNTSGAEKPDAEKPAAKKAAMHAARPKPRT